MSKVEQLFKRFLHSLTNEEKEEVENELETMDVEEVAEEIAEDIVDTTNEPVDDDAEAEDDNIIDAGEDSDIDSEDGADDVQAGVEAEGEAPEAEAESEGDEDDVFSETEVAEADDDAEAERIDDKRLTEIEAKLDMIIQMLTTSGPDGNHVPFVNIPGRSRYHDDMDLGEATRVLLTGKL